MVAYNLGRRLLRRNCSAENPITGPELGGLCSCRSSHALLEIHTRGNGRAVCVPAFAFGPCGSLALIPRPLNGSHTVPAIVSSCGDRRAVIYRRNRPRHCDGPPRAKVNRGREGSVWRRHDVVCRCVKTLAPAHGTCNRAPLHRLPTQLKVIGEEG